VRDDDTDDLLAEPPPGDTEATRVLYATGEQSLKRVAAPSPWSRRPPPLARVRPPRVCVVKQCRYASPLSVRSNGTKHMREPAPPRMMSSEFCTFFDAMRMRHETNHLRTPSDRAAPLAPLPRCATLVAKAAVMILLTDTSSPKRRDAVAHVTHPQEWMPPGLLD
jgi:hypothetical protein